MLWSYKSKQEKEKPKQKVPTAAATATIIRMYICILTAFQLRDTHCVVF